MKNSKKEFSGTGQSTTEVRKSQKHDANLQKNSSLYFQIGLILCLLGTYALFEMQFQEKKINFVEEEVEVDKLTIDYVPPYIVEVIKPKTIEKLPSSDLIDIVKVVKDDDPFVQNVIDLPKSNKSMVETPFTLGDVPDVDTSDDVIVDFVAVEKVPVYPGCEKRKTNEGRKKCMSDKINKLIGKRFDVDIASGYGLSGKQRIFTQFTIDKLGNVTDIKIRGPHPVLEKEANRVINKIPKMKPGIQGDVPVGVVYSLPITYQVRN
ncbi:energy transducer TonB [Winogradskyella undariae]|uniref:energy transducer TonB n=1 Tax=Winogradskyella undariae TaxID=1285465 RepID=UPI00156BB5B2|nr:energy transducer TonB [Winogradskyella undariae]NRR90867.1 energy transducer TonB [Winogradskyella undariae]